MKVNVVLNLGSTSNAEVLVDAAHYTTSMTGNALFAAADIVAQVTATVTATTNLRTALNAPTSDTKTDTINAAREVLDRNLTILASKVEGVANNPTLLDDQRAGVVHSAGMQMKGIVIPKKRTFAVVNGNVQGSVHITAASGAKAHEWQYTDDVINFTKRIAVPATTTASTDILGLNNGTKYAFFHKPVVVGTATDWEGPVFNTVI